MIPAEVPVSRSVPSTTLHSSWFHGRWPLLLVSTIAAVAGAFTMHWYVRWSSPTVATVQTEDDSAAIVEVANATTESASSDFVELPQSQWPSSGIEIEPLRPAKFSKTIRLTGKVSLNQDRIAHIYPMVEGAVESVSVSLGKTVKAEELLAVIHSREIGESKLKLYQARLQLEMARTKNQLQTEVAENARELIKALREDTPIEKIEVMFRNRPMGVYREQVLAAYSKFLKSAADVSRLEGIAGTGAVSGKQLLTAEANRNADQATYQSRIEQIEYELRTSTLLSSQAVREAETQVAVAETSLRILGCQTDELIAIDPANQGETISHYAIRAPFDGTVLTKDVVLSEQVRPDVMLLSIADLSTVWVNADIYEEHVSLLGSLEDRKVTFENEAWPDRKFEATVFYTGDIMDETTRTISMRAIAENTEHLLKPGMFVTVALSGATEDEVLQVPLSAVQEHEGQKFVFVHEQGETFKRYDIQIGAANESAVVIHDGVQIDQAVVTKGGFMLKSRMLADLMGEE